MLPRKFYSMKANELAENLDVAKDALKTFKTGPEHLRSRVSAQERLVLELTNLRKKKLLEEKDAKRKEARAKKA